MLRSEFSRELEGVLDKLDIQSNQDLMIHSDIIITAEYEGSLEENLNAFFMGLTNRVSPNGTLIVPSFSMSYTQGKVYNIQKSLGTVGQAAEFFRMMPGVLRTLDPIYNFCIQGPKIGSYNIKPPVSCFGKDSIFDEFYKKKGVILFFGCSIDRATFVHYVEEKRNVSYRYYKKFSGKTVTCNQIIDNSISLYVRNLELNTIPDHSALKNHLSQTGRLKKVKLGRFACYSVRAKDFFDAANELLDIDEYSLIAEGVTRDDVNNDGRE